MFGVRFWVWSAWAREVVGVVRDVIVQGEGYAMVPSCITSVWSGSTSGLLQVIQFMVPTKHQKMRSRKSI